MKTIATFNFKGGVGKTTTAINLGIELAAAGRRVVMVDADGQGNMTSFFEQDDVAAHGGWTTYSVLSGTCDNINNALIQVRDGVRLLPSSSDLAVIELDAYLKHSCVNLDGLRTLCVALAEDGKTDFVIIDCPPSFSPQSLAALVAADEVVVPVSPDGWAVSGLHDLIQSVHGARQTNPCINVKILLTLAANNATTRDTARSLQASSFPTFKTMIHWSAYVGRATFNRKPLREFAPCSRVAADYKDLANEILEVEHAV